MDARLFDEYLLALGEAECAAAEVSGEIGGVGVAGAGASILALLARTVPETVLGGAEHLT